MLTSMGRGEGIGGTDDTSPADGTAVVAEAIAVEVGGLVIVLTVNLLFPFLVVLASDPTLVPLQTAVLEVRVLGVLLLLLLLVVVTLPL